MMAYRIADASFDLENRTSSLALNHSLARKRENFSARLARGAAARPMADTKTET
jgi:hypothetical protein